MRCDNVTINEKFDKEKAKRAAAEIDKLASKHKSEGKSSTELIREWRDKRK